MNIHIGNERWHQAASFALRYEVFVLEQGIALTDEFDTLDTLDRNYFSIYDDSMIVGTIRLQYKNHDTLWPDRLCVKKNFRHLGIGTQLLVALETYALSEKIFLSELSAELEALPFYEKNGYHSISQPFLEDGISCVKMVKNLREIKNS